MAIFSEKRRLAPVWRDLSGQMEGSRIHLRLFWSRVGLLVAREQEAMSLWVPVAIGSGIACYFSLPQEPYLGWTLISLGIALGIALASAFGLGRRGWGAIAAFAVLWVVLGFAAAQMRTIWVAAPALQNEIVGAQLQGEVLTASRNQQGGSILLVSPTRIGSVLPEELPARVRLRVNQAHDPIWPGDKIATRVMLWPPGEPVAPGAFDFARQSWFRQMGATGVTLTAPRVLAGERGVTWAVKLAALREQIARRVMNTMRQDVGPVAAAMMTGQRHAISETVEQNLRDAGLAHILAISGLHMALFAGTLFWVVRAALALVPRLALRYPLKKWAAAAALIGAFAYLLLSGMSVTAQRAFIMAALMFLAILVDRPALSLRNVALAATIILLTRPESVLEPGFQMSFAAVTALIAIYQNRELQLLGLREKSTGVSGLFRFALIYIATLALTSLVAGTATAPFAAYHFNRMAVYGIVGNLLAMPLVGIVIMPAALLAYLLMPFGLDAPALWIMEQGLIGVVAIATEVSSWEGAVVHAPSFSSLGLGFVALGGLLLALLQTKLRRAGIAFLVVGGVFATQERPPDILIDGDARLVAVRNDEGQYMWTGSTARYARETWLRRSGMSADTRIRDHLMACDSLGCIAQGGPIQRRLTIAVSKTTGSLSDDCARADILIAHVPVRGRLRARCNASLIIDRFDIARHGAHAIYLSEGPGPTIERIVTVREWRGERPWTGSQN
ncbi:MAG: metal-binding protein [Rhodobiaceae bacterium]|nr:MAG: metal-binding protein [Rhodobiaceae bacterium]